MYYNTLILSVLNLLQYLSDILTRPEDLVSVSAAINMDLILFGYEK